MDSFNKDIIAAIKSGKNEIVLNRLYKELLPKIRKLILKNSGTTEDANDVFQDAILILFKHIKLNKFDEAKDIGGFVYSVARNIWITKTQRAKKFVQMEETEHVHETAPDALHDLMNEEKLQAIEETMSKIGADCKKLLKLSIYDKLSMREIAEEMGYSSEDVAKTYNYRCKKKFVDMVKNNPSILAIFKK